MSKITDEQLDDMDCRPVSRGQAIAVPDYLARLREETLARKVEPDRNGPAKNGQQPKRQPIGKADTRK